MARISDIIDKRLRELNIKGSKMCDDLGISRSTLTELRKGRVNTLKADRAAMIADYLGVTVDYLLGLDPNHLDILVAAPTDILSERVTALCKKHQITIDELEKEVGFPHGIIQQWGNNAPNIVSITPVAEYFNVSIDYLIGRSEIKSTVESLMNDTHFNSMLRVWENLTEENKEWFEVILRLGINPKHFAKAILSYLDIAKEDSEPVFTRRKESGKIKEWKEKDENRTPAI